MNKVYYLFIFLLISPTLQNSLEENFKDFCDSESFEALEWDDQKFGDKRKARDNTYFEEYENIYEYIDDEESRKLVDAVLAPFILLIIFIFVVLITMIFCLLSLLGKLETKSSSTNACVVMNYLCYLLFFGFFVTFVVWIGLIVPRRRKAMCFYY